jgi:hypothetical protein
MAIRQDLTALAARQHGVLSAEDLRTLGVTRGKRRVLINRGDLVAVGPNAHRMTGFPTTARQSIMLACVRLDSVASHETAGALSQLGSCCLLPVHVLGTRVVRARGATALATAHTTTNLPADDVTMIDGIPCTSVARTLLLIAGMPGADEARVRGLVDEAIRDGKATDPWLWWRLERLRCRGRAGVILLEAILAARAGGAVTESWLERRFLELVAEAGLPTPKCQQRVDHHGAFAGRVDFLFGPQRLAVEVLGHAFHASPAQLTADAERRTRLQLAGYRVIEFTYDQIVRDPVCVIAMLTEALGLPRAA